MLDVAKLHILTDATLPALAKLNCAAKVELGLQKKVGSAGGASADLQAVLKGAQQPLAELFKFMSESDDPTSLTPTKVEPALTELRLAPASLRSENTASWPASALRSNACVRVRECVCVCVCV